MVGPEVELMQFKDEAGNLVESTWVEADWDGFRSMGLARPLPVFRPNRYPYQLPVVDGCVAEHWILWYFHFPHEPPADPSDEVIESDLVTAIMEVATSRGSDTFD